ncbi:MAG: ferrochelatase, partial [Okeania sp. SIO2D1]|nr:ferrochelatase [Okeania sp. SIO2D1]
GIDESQTLYELVRERLINRFPLISVGWLNHDTPLIDWTQPDAKTAAKNLIELGATAIIFMPIGFATENHETLLDVEHIIEAIRRKYPEVTYRQMRCANDRPEFLKMAADWANLYIEELLSENALAVNPSLAVAQAKKTHSHSHGGEHGHSHGHHHHHDHDHHHHH